MAVNTDPFKQTPNVAPVSFKNPGKTQRKFLSKQEEKLPYMSISKTRIK